MDQRSGFPRADRAGDARPIGRHWNLRPPACPLSLAASLHAPGEVWVAAQSKIGVEIRIATALGVTHNGERLRLDGQWPTSAAATSSKRVMVKRPSPDSA